MTYKIFVLATLWFLLTGRNVYAQKKVYSLEDVWSKSQNYYPSLSSKKYQIERQELKKNLVKKEWLPEVNIQSQTSYGSYQGVSGSFFPLPGIYNTSGNNKSLSGQSKSLFNIYSSALLQWNFLQFGRIRAKLNAATAAVQISNEALAQEELRLKSSVTRQYFEVLKSSAFLSVSKADVQRLKDLFELSKAQADAGLRPGADTLLVKSEYYQIKGQVNEQRASQETAMLQLASLIGEDANSFTVNTSLYNINRIAAEIPAIDSLDNHPYLQYLKANLLFADAKLETVKRQPYPTLGLLAGTGIRGSGIQSSGMVNNSFSEPWKNNVGSYLVGVDVTWNLSSLYQNKVKQKIAQKEIQSAKADYEEAGLQLRTSYRAALNRWQQQREKVIDSRTALTSSQEAYELYVTRYQSGLINLIELLQLQKTLQDAGFNYAKATGAYWDELINQSETTGNFSLLLSQTNP